MRKLPHQERERFLREYRSALDAAHELWRYRQLQDVLRLWHLRAVAYQQRDLNQRAKDARHGASEHFVPAEEAIRGWSQS